MSAVAVAAATPGEQARTFRPVRFLTLSAMASPVPAVCLLVSVNPYTVLAAFLSVALVVRAAHDLPGEPGADRHFFLYFLAAWTSMAIGALIGGDDQGSLRFAIGPKAGLVGALATVFGYRPMGPEPSQTVTHALGATVTPLLTLETNRHTLATLARELRDLPRPTIASAELTSAWAAKNTARIEALLMEMQRQLTTEWLRGIDRFNQAVAYVDRARGALRQRLDHAETLMKTLGLDAKRVQPGRSKRLAGDAPVLKVKRDLSQRLNYAQGFGMAAGKTIGRAPWQIVALTTAAAVAGTVIMHFVNESRQARKLADLQGKLTAEAELARGDLDQFATILATRLLPQHDRILDVIRLLETLGETLAASDGGAVSPRDATAFAMAVADGRQMLSMEAGN